MTTGSRPETASSSGGDVAILSPVSSTSSHPSSSSHSHGTGNLPVPPPPERQPSGKARSVGPTGSQRFKVLGRKGKDKRRSIGGFEDDEEDWTLEGMNGDRTGVTVRHGLETRISPPSPTKEDPSRTKLVEEPMSNPPLSDSQLTEVPAKSKKSRGRGLVKKTSRMFSRDKDKEAPLVTPGNPSTLGPNKASRQSSYSSAHSIDSAVTSSSTASNRPPSTARNGTGTGNKSNHLRRLSQDSQFSRQAQGSIRSGVMSIRESSDEGKRSSSNGLSASVPSLNRHALPQPGSSSRTGTESTIPSRMSSWITNFLPVSSSTTNETTTPAPVEPPVTSSPARKGPSAAANFLYAARQKAVDGMRQLLDTEALPDKSPDTIWVMGVGHPGYRPSTPSESPTALVGGDMSTEFFAQRRGSSSSGKASPPIKSDQANLRPAVWPKRKDPGQASSPPPKSFGSIFSTSTLSLALPNSSSPSKDTDARSTLVDSPSKGKRKEKEVIRWPEQFHNDFRTIVWCTYRAQYAPIVSLPGRLLVPTPEAYYSAFAPPIDATTNELPRPKPSTSMSLPNRPSTSPWAWTRSGEERGLTSDAGWGCMLRTGQSMLANALVHLHLGRDWRVPVSKPDSESRTQSALDEIEDYATYVRLLSWFLDDPSPLCPFSVHRMALIGKELGKEVGEWFGPSTAAGALKTLTNSFSPCGLAVATATDSMIYKSDVYAASNLPSTGWFDDDSDSTPTTLPTTASKRSSSGRGRVWGDKAVLILVGLRLGLDGVNPIYYDSIKALFTFPQSVGIAGGRPSSSYYFVASQANSLFYLDPHLTRPAVPLETPPAPTHRVPLKPRTRRPVSTTEDVDELVLIESPTKKSANPKASSGFALDGGDLSDDDTSPSPTHRVRKPAVRNLAGLGKTTPPGSPTRAPKSPDSPTTPLAPSPTCHEDEEVFIDSTHPTPTAPLPTRSRSNNEPQPDSESEPEPKVERDRDPSLEWYANAYSEAQLRTFHCEKVKKISLSGLDPSMLLGFMCRDEAEFEDFCERVSRLPHKIFTVQDEPPVWNDNDDAGLESVSEPDMEDDDERGPSSTFTASPPGIKHAGDDDADDDDDDEEDEEEMLQDEFTTTTKNAIEIEKDDKRLGALKAPAITQATLEDKDKGQVEGEGGGNASEGRSEMELELGSGMEMEKKPRPPKPRPLQSMGPIGTDTQSWIRPTTSGQEAPNGRNVL